MKQIFKLIGIIAIVTVIGLAFFACGGDDYTHTHDWKWVVTKAATENEEGEETKICATCGATDGTRPIDKIPEARSESISLFNGGGKAIVEGTMLEAEWAGVADKVKGALDDALNVFLNTGEMGDLSMYGAVFDIGNNVVITVEKNPTYNNYKVVNGVLYLNADSAMSIASIKAAVTLVKSGGSGITKVTPLKATPLKEVHIIKFVHVTV